MNCIRHTRHLGRRITLTTTDGRVSQTEHHETMPIGMIGAATSQPVQRDEMRVRFDGGGEVCVSLLGDSFHARPGQKVTAVRADDGDDSSLLHCFNHETGEEWFNDSALKGLRKGARVLKLFWLVPLLALLGAWMSPAQTRADIADWLEQKTLSSASAGSHTTGLGETVRLARMAVAPPAEAPSRATSAAALARSGANYALDGWRDRNWIAFGVLLGVLIPLCVALGRVLVVWPATTTLRSRVQRLGQQHRKAVGQA